MKYLLSVATFFAGLTFVASSAFAYVSPGKATGFVNDYTGTLSVETKANLENLLTSFQASGTGEISVVIIPTLAGDSIEEYSLQLAREWGIGQKGKDNGALLLIANDDRELRIEVGYGFEGTLTDAKSSRIINEVITPRFREGDYNAGVTNGVKEMVGLLNPSVAGGEQTVNYDAPAPMTRGEEDITGFVFGILGFLMFVGTWIVSILARSKSWWAGGIIGGVFGLIVSLFVGFVFTGMIIMGVLVALGLLFDYAISKGYQQSVINGTRSPWWTGGSGGFGGGRSSGGGFGSFGGGSFGGGGASGKW